MSFQPQVPSVSQPPPPHPAPPPPPVLPPAKGKRRKGLIIFGIILVVAGIVGGAGIVAKGMSNYEAAVKSLARAPVGCTTTLEFDKPATFTIYVETKGKLSELSGDCDASGGSYSHPGSKLPKVSMTLVDSNGEEIDLQRGVTAEYDVAGYEGIGVRTMRIPEAGTYRLNVESDESDFAVAIGKNPKDALRSDARHRWLGRTRWSGAGPAVHPAGPPPPSSRSLARHCCAVADVDARDPHAASPRPVRPVCRHILDTGSILRHR